MCYYTIVLAPPVWIRVVSQLTRLGQINIIITIIIIVTILISSVIVILLLLLKCFCFTRISVTIV